MRNYQSGFGLVEGILIILILAVVSFGGYAVWHNESSKNSASASNTTSSIPTISESNCLKQGGQLGPAITATKNNPQASGIYCTIGNKSYKLSSASSSGQNSSQAYLTIKEWGVKVPLDSNTAGLSYKYDATSQYKIASFRDDALNSASTMKGCDANSVLVVRGTANDKWIDEIGDPSDSYATVYQSELSNDFGIHAIVDSYYYVNAGTKGASCVDLPDSTTAGAQAQQKEQAAEKNIIEALNKMVAE